MEERSKLVEITRIDPVRWGLLHIPFGVVYGIVQAYEDVMKSSAIDIETVAFLFGFIVFSAILAGLGGFVYAVLLNLIMYLLRRGPIFTVREVPAGIDERLHLRGRAKPPQPPTPPARSTPGAGEFVINTWSTPSDVPPSLDKDT